MNVGDYGILNGDVVRLRDKGKQGGCKNDLWLAYISDIRDTQLLRDGINFDNLPDIVVDTDDVSV